MPCSPFGPRNLCLFCERTFSLEAQEPGTPETRKKQAAHTLGWERGDAILRSGRPPGGRGGGVLAMCRQARKAASRCAGQATGLSVFLQHFEIWAREQVPQEAVRPPSSLRMY